MHWGQDTTEAARRLSGLVYVATPYTKLAAPRGVFDWPRADAAAHKAAGAVAMLAMRGVSAVSPIVIAHAACDWWHSQVNAGFAERAALDAMFWTRWCAPLLDAARMVYVPAIEGWHESDGVAREVAHALSGCKPVIFEASLWDARRLGLT